VSASESKTGDLYAGREQTLVKHFILNSYLERFARIVGNFWDAITYVDCFSGPWNVQSERLEDSSFSIALKQLRRASSDLAEHGRSLSIRCFFLESSPHAYRRLKQFADSTTDAEVETRNATLEESIAAICNFVKRGGPTSFPFIFVDPTGWSGFATDVIAPLLRFQPGEVLVNFMTSHILRFAQHSDPNVRASFDRLFGSVDYRRRIAGLAGQDREDELVRCYMDAIRDTGSLEHVCSALVLHPERDRTHFHLIYGTRSLKGVEVFKDTEKKAMRAMEAARASAQQRHRVQRSGQAELFAPDVVHRCAHYDRLRDRYLGQARRKVSDHLRGTKRVPYEDLYTHLIRFPLVWESDLKDWISEWRAEATAEIEGLGPRKKVPKRGQGHVVVWKG
jgi:three-Cys-motif partner protein